MIATHNIKVNGRWYAPGEEYPCVEPVEKADETVKEEKAEEPVKEEQKPETKPKAATSRRKKISE